MNRIVKHLLIMLLASLGLAISLQLIIGNYGNPFGFAVGFVVVYLLTLTTVPFVIGGIPTLIIYMRKKEIWNNFFSIIWIVWILVVAIVSYGTIAGNL